MDHIRRRTGATRRLTAVAGVVSSRTGAVPAARCLRHRTPLLLLDAPPLETWTDTAVAAGLLAVRAVSGPENVGAVIRTAAALGVARVVLLQKPPIRSIRAARASPAARCCGCRCCEGRRSVSSRPPSTVLPCPPAGEDIAGFEFPASFGLLVGLEDPACRAVGRVVRWRSRCSPATNR
jgi:hypothetical protein